MIKNIISNSRITGLSLNLVLVNITIALGSPYEFINESIKL